MRIITVILTIMKLPVNLGSRIDSELEAKGVFDVFSVSGRTVWTVIINFFGGRDIEQTHFQCHFCLSQYAFD